MQRVMATGTTSYSFKKLLDKFMDNRSIKGKSRVVLTHLPMQHVLPASTEAGCGVRCAIHRDPAA